ncbi:hypothetical protein EJ04DRAFT_513785 [Polyplosphaeria fusca]|uniref:Uncharacterized protein n=1 Tax=Polyplosphaeria fusca TaxID=682080 RepID=A0A9P4QRT3_9PLEO|nr:hypothetical protein EJ04DRAFT_513785 [Polyplosphaeria fusca]
MSETRPLDIIIILFHSPEMMFPSRPVRRRGPAQLATHCSAARESAVRPSHVRSGPFTLPKCVCLCLLGSAVLAVFLGRGR